MPVRPIDEGKPTRNSPRRRDLLRHLVKAPNASDFAPFRVFVVNADGSKLQFVHFLNDQEWWRITSCFLGA
jgi:hypothetical protein